MRRILRLSPAVVGSQQLICSHPLYPAAMASHQLCSYLLLIMDSTRHCLPVSVAIPPHSSTRFLPLSSSRRVVSCSQQRTQLPPLSRTLAPFHKPQIQPQPSPRNSGDETLVKLNEEQLRAVQTDESCVRVIAGPGSGKTRVLTHRIAHLIRRKGVSPSNILCITFTNKAANELCERLDQLLGCKTSGDLMVGTFHSFCAKLLRWRPDFGIDKDFAIFDEDDCEKLIKNIATVAGNALSNKFNSYNNVGVLLEKYNIQYSKSNQTTSREEETLHDLSSDLMKLGFLTEGSAENLLLLGCLEFTEEHNKQLQKRKPFKIRAAAVRSLLHLVLKARAHVMKEFVAKKRQRHLGPFPTSIQSECLKMAELYECSLRKNNAVDFDDLINLAVRLLHQHHSFRESCQDQWMHVLVDEFQDTDAVQYELVCLLASKHQNLFVVGDIDQAIYGWRGAEYLNMQNALEYDFPSVVTFQLQRNYRSAANILRAASMVLHYCGYDREIGSAKALTLLPTKGYTAPIGIGEFQRPELEAMFVVSEMQNLVERKLGDWESFAILYRTRTQSFAMEASLLKAQMPYKLVGAVPFYSHKEIKVLMAYLQLIANPHNEVALEYCINIPPRGIGEQTIAHLKRWATSENLSLPHALEKILKESITSKALGLRSNSRDAVLQFMYMIQSFIETSLEKSVGQIIKGLIERLNYIEYVEALEDGKTSNKRLERLQQLRANADASEIDYGVGRPALLRFLQDLTLVAEQEGKDVTSKDAVKLMTVHASKGLEFDCVFLTGASDGLMPLSGSDLNEERRLFYVGITRARERLYMTYNVHSQKDQSRRLEPSRFVREILLSLPKENFVFYS